LLVIRLFIYIFLVHLGLYACASRNVENVSQQSHSKVDSINISQVFASKRFIDCDSYSYFLHNVIDNNSGRLQIVSAKENYVKLRIIDELVIYNDFSFNDKCFRNLNSYQELVFDPSCIELNFIELIKSLLIKDDFEYVKSMIEQNEVVDIYFDFNGLAFQIHCTNNEYYFYPFITKIKHNNCKEYTQLDSFLFSEINVDFVRSIDNFIILNKSSDPSIGKNKIILNTEFIGGAIDSNFIHTIQLFTDLSHFKKMNGLKLLNRLIINESISTPKNLSKANIIELKYSESISILFELKKHEIKSLIIKTGKAETIFF